METRLASGRPFSVVLVDLDKFKEVNRFMATWKATVLPAWGDCWKQSAAVERGGRSRRRIHYSNPELHRAGADSFPKIAVVDATDPILSGHRFRVASASPASLAGSAWRISFALRSGDVISKHAGEPVFKVSFRSDEGAPSNADDRVLR